ncbi:acyl transferase/acyl hydrolase/lysophospholipase [Lasiosphaeris hirsuta]|uniref:Acyl transferase/acyl hydrolase/lysophospholipase n=1 Tax=Lasiosphaeris hirsuta TaxID=260670 RepID=A0AA40B8F4_9PEZI|nr:acyl transferase/acyl hydrolase/lysophospholipase [Lasiosphaeris hirsuta]
MSAVQFDQAGTQAGVGSAPAQENPPSELGVAHTSAQNPRSAPLDVIPLRTHELVTDEGVDGPWTKKTVLAFDGGGVRGYSSLLILKRLMEEIQRIELELNLNATASAFYEWQGAVSYQGHDPHAADGVYLPCHYFDYMAGTSTGGLSAIMLGRLRMSVDDALAQYAEFGNEVFGKARWWHERSMLWYPRAKYPSRKARAAIQRIIYERLSEDDPDIGLERAIREPFKSREDRTRTMVFSFCIDKETGISTTHLWRTYDNIYGTRTLRGSEAHTEEIWKVARATSAAPRYFESIKMGGRGDKQKHLDGGMCANNPSLKAFSEVRRLHRQAPAFFVSIGTGKKVKTSNSRPDRLRLRDFENATRIDDVRRKQFIKKYLEIGSRWREWMTDTEGDQGAQGWEEVAEEYGMPHERFNVEGDLARIPLDDWRPINTGETTLRKMRELTEEYLAQEDQVRRIAETARALVNIRRERARTERWEKFATDVTYKCPSRPHCGASGRYKDRTEFREHVMHDNYHIGLRDNEHDLEHFLNTGRRHGRDRNGNISRVGTT